MTTYFLDNNFSPKFKHALCALGEEVTHIQEDFAPNTPDEEWIPAVGARGWTLVSIDRRITRNPQQRIILEQAGIVSFFAKGGIASLALWDQFVWLVKVWPSIKKMRDGCSAPRTFMVTQQHKVLPWGK